MQKISTISILVLLVIQLQAQFYPTEDTLSAIGWKLNIDTLNLKKKISDSLISQSKTIPTGKIGNDAKNIKFSANSNQNEIYFNIYGSDQKRRYLDISSHPIVYVKVKGLAGDFIQPRLHSDAYSYYDKTADSIVNISSKIFWAPNMMQRLTCSDYTWYKFDFSTIPAWQDGIKIENSDSSKFKNRITGISFSNITDGINSRPEGYFFSFDSLIFGNVNLIPQSQTPTYFIQNIQNNENVYSKGKDISSKVNDGIQLTFSEKNDNIRGINFQINEGSSLATIVDITNFPFIQLTYKGATNDTLRCNLKYYGSSQDDRPLINNLTNDEIINGNKEVAFDFASFLGNPNYKLDKIIEVQLLLNPDRSESGTLTITKLEIGSYMNNCDPSVNVHDTKISKQEINVFPNPCESGHILNIVGKYTSGQLLDCNGNLVYQGIIKDQQIEIPEFIRTGFYIFVLAGAQNKSYSKIQIK